MSDQNARYLRSEAYPFKRSHLVALRPTKISALDPPSTWGAGKVDENFRNTKHMTELRLEPQAREAGGRLETNKE